MVRFLIKICSNIYFIELDCSFRLQQILYLNFVQIKGEIVL